MRRGWAQPPAAGGARREEAAYHLRRRIRTLVDGLVGAVERREIDAALESSDPDTVVDRLQALQAGADGAAAGGVRGPLQAPQAAGPTGRSAAREGRD